MYEVRLAPKYLLNYIYLSMVVVGASGRRSSHAIQRSRPLSTCLMSMKFGNYCVEKHMKNTLRYPIYIYIYIYIYILAVFLNTLHLIDNNDIL